MSQLAVRYVFDNGCAETRAIQAEVWPAVIVVQVYPADGPPRDVRLLWTDEFHGDARIYQEEP